MRTRSLLLCLLVSITTQNCMAQAGSADNKSLLWKITGKHMTKPSYLFGTIHLICPDDYLWTDKMKESLQKSEEVCLEMDMDDPAVMMQAAASFIDNSGKKLQDYFTTEQYTKLSKYVKDSAGMDIAMLQQMKPIAVQTLFAAKSAGCPNPVAYEEKIMATAKADKKEIVGLEDPKEQIAVLESLPIDSVVKEINELVNNSSAAKDRQEYTAMVAAYKKQDLPALYLLMEKSDDIGNSMEVFLDDRNKKWIDRMADKMEQKSVFFAVGAGHLWGKNGVINLLKNAGYTVTPLH